MTNCQLLECVASHETQYITDIVGRFPFFCSHLTISLADVEGKERVKRDRRALVFQDARRAARKDSFVAKLSIHNE